WDYECPNEWNFIRDDNFGIHKEITCDLMHPVPPFVCLNVCIVAQYTEGYWKKFQKIIPHTE
ncbi:MAG: hypothetical protein IKF69_14890, partial [Exiguobacterium sp.]|nr:hypothetical protein [Exiguobacterium sp.]